MADCDVLIIGAGHNGLTTPNHLVNYCSMDLVFWQISPVAREFLRTM